MSSQGLGNASRGARQEGRRAVAGALVLAVLSGCASGGSYGSGVPSGVRPASAELRASYCHEVWRRETEKDQSARTTGSWLLGLGVGALLGAGVTALAATQTDRKQTDKTLLTVSEALALPGAAGVVAGGFVLGLNDHDEAARKAAMHTTEIVGEGEKEVDEETLDARNKATISAFRKCLGLPEDSGSGDGSDAEASSASSAGAGQPADGAAK